MTGMLAVSIPITIRLLLPFLNMNNTRLKFFSAPGICMLMIKIEITNGLSVFVYTSLNNLALAIYLKVDLPSIGEGWQSIIR